MHRQFDLRAAIDRISTSNMIDHARVRGTRNVGASRDEAAVRGLYALSHSCRIAENRICSATHMTTSWQSVCVCAGVLLDR
jgi:hypothetical protein